MFVTHPDTAIAVRQMEHRLLLAKAAEARRVAEAGRFPAARPAGATSPWHFGSVLLSIGRRLHGAKPVGHPGTAMAGSGAPS